MDLRSARWTHRRHHKGAVRTLGMRTIPFFPPLSRAPLRPSIQRLQFISIKRVIYGRNAVIKVDVWCVPVCFPRGPECALFVFSGGIVFAPTLHTFGRVVSVMMVLLVSMKDPVV